MPEPYRGEKYSADAAAFQSGINANADPSATLQRIYGRIQAERMAGIPVLNPVLHVEALGFRPWRDGWAGVLITPWCMNLMLIGSRSATPEPRPGQSVTHRLGEEEYRFTAAEDAELGAFQSCSLFSPMFEFPNQATAVAVAEYIVTTLFDVPAEKPEVDFSRRQLLRGQWTRKNPSHP